MSQRVEQIKGVKISRLQSGEPAVYVSSTINDSAIVTDVLMMKNGEFINLNSTGRLAYSVKALRNYYLYMIEYETSSDIRRDVYNAMVRVGAVILDMQSGNETLEDMFLKLTSGKYDSRKEDM